MALITMTLNDLEAHLSCVKPFYLVKCSMCWRWYLYVAFTVNCRVKSEGLLKVQAVKYTVKV